jgi:hypothetical protein
MASYPSPQAGKLFTFFFISASYPFFFFSKAVWNPMKKCTGRHLARATHPMAGWITIYYSNVSNSISETGTDVWIVVVLSTLYEVVGQFCI